MITAHLPKLLPRQRTLQSIFQNESGDITESPQFDTRLRQGQRTQLDIATCLQPAGLKLRVKWSPVPFDQRVQAIQATYGTPSTDYQTIPFVQPTIQTCQGVNLNFDSMGEMTFANQTEAFQGYSCQDWVINNHQPLLYYKPFATPQESHLRVRELNRQPGQWYYSSPRYPEGVGNLQPLFCYGAFCHTQSRFEDVVPYYVQIAATVKETSLLFKKQTTLHGQGIYETAKPLQKFYFHDAISLDQQLTLAEAIKQGFCQVSVNTQGGEPVIMKSYKFDGESANAATLNIYFK